VRADEIPARKLGARIEAFDERRPVLSDAAGPGESATTAVATSSRQVRHTGMSRVSEPTVPEQAVPVVEPLHPAVPADEVELSELYLGHRGEILAFLIPMTRDPEVAEDILQDTFIRLIREARAGRMPDNVRAWLYRVAANLAISRGRRVSTLFRILPRLLERGEPPRPEAEFLHQERDAELHAALGRMRPDGRAALLLAAEGFNGHEIAAAIGRSESATRTLLYRSRIELRRLAEAAEVGP
jgi:RNA polymerase sigma-70 factor (ECF subfamily)